MAWYWWALTVFGALLIWAWLAFCKSLFDDDDYDAEDKFQHDRWPEKHEPGISAEELMYRTELDARLP